MGRRRLFANFIRRPFGGASEGEKRALGDGRGRQCDFIKTRHGVKEKMNKNEIFIRELWANEEKTAGGKLSAWVEEVARFCGVGVSAVWAWYSGERSPSAAARKLLRLRSLLPDELKKRVPSL